MEQYLEYKFVFEKLEVWQLSKELAVELYGATNKFPVEERYGLVSQINRSVISVVSNIAEGASRTSKKDRAHFYQIAYSSLMEVAAQLIIACELSFISSRENARLRERLHEISNKLNALYKSQLNN
jgi:four helix bundle protein